jgi:peptidoglycan/LPS O-acetylase OafA/YrhL
MQKERIAGLDGVRAVAILLVVGFHYFCRYTPPHFSTNLYPHGDTLAGVPLFSDGYLGVELFFIVSGWVISLTLSSSYGAMDFACRRIARLLPTMVLSSIVTLLVVKALPGSPFEYRAQFKNLLPSVTFSEPTLWQAFTGRTFSEIDGVYWSLQVEIKFYAWACLLFYIRKANDFAFRCIVFFNVALLLELLQAHFGNAILGSVLRELLISEYLPWFAAGIGFYFLSRNPRDRYGAVLVVESLAVLILRWAFGDRADPISLVATMAFFCLFALLIFRPRSVALLSSKPFAAIGEASYSLYLLHNVIGVTLLAVIFRNLGPNVTVGIASATVIALAMIGISLVVYRVWEVPGKRLLLRVLRSHIRTMATPEHVPDLSTHAHHGSSGPSEGTLPPEEDARSIDVAIARPEAPHT